jgi:hypothetical protein
VRRIGRFARLPPGSVGPMLVNVRGFGGWVDAFRRGYPALVGSMVSEDGLRGAAMPVSARLGACYHRFQRRCFALRMVFAPGAGCETVFALRQGAEQTYREIRGRRMMAWLDRRRSIGAGG